MIPVAPPADFGSVPVVELLDRLGSAPGGLSQDAAAERREARAERSPTAARLLRIAQLALAQFKSPITLILIAAALVSLFLHNVTDAAIILAIVLASAALGFWQEFAATNALDALAATVAARTAVLRNGQEIAVPNDEVVPGDVLLLSAGSTLPADGRLLESHDLFVNESALTGESFPVEKTPGELAADTPLAGRRNVVFQGSHVVSGTGRAVAALVGAQTQLGQIGQRLRLRSPETDFERGVRRFGNLLFETTLLMVLGIFVTHLALHRPALEALLFSLALAVGLTPQLLPAVISVNLTHGARRLAACRVIVKRLASIENLGGMTVLCSDKTGTLTEGTVEVGECVDVDGRDHPRALGLAAMNAAFETGFSNPIDAALRTLPSADPSAAKLDEIPYDFVRKRLSVLVRTGGRRLLIIKGALPNVLSICVDAETATGERLPIEAARGRIEALFHRFGERGDRVIAVAFREHDRDHAGREDETGLTFSGLVVLRDPPRAGIAETVARLNRLGVALKMITGDNRVVAASVAARVGLDADGATLTGSELRALSDDALLARAPQTRVFAEIEPNQKERVILALKRAGHVVGYLGDGINDATALRAADVGISVDGAVDVAREAADIILLEHDLNVLVDGVREGRSTFANTLKYIFLAASANFGNMFSMAGVSLFLPYLPLLPKQILLTNLLTDLPEMTIAGDRVDPEMIDRPQRWDIPLIQRFVIVFGLLSSVFDFATFGVLLWLLGAGQDEFRTGWFVESIVSACSAVLIVRSRQPLWTSRPSAALLATTAAVIAATLLLPFLPLAKPLGLVPLPASFLAAMLTIVVAYMACAEMLKRWFFRAVGKT